MLCVTRIDTTFEAIHDQLVNYTKQKASQVFYYLTVLYRFQLRERSKFCPSYRTMA